MFDDLMRLSGLSMSFTWNNVRCSMTCITMDLGGIDSKYTIEYTVIMNEGRYRCFPFVLDELACAPFVLGIGVLDVRGFLEEVSADSFMTIFACISSSLDAFTFFGQKSVTKLQRGISEIIVE